MYRDRNKVLFNMLKLILETEEAKKSKNEFELSRLQVDRIISQVAFSINVNTINQYWKQLFWEGCATSSFRGHDVVLQRYCTFALFNKKKCETLLKELEK